MDFSMENKKKAFRFNFLDVIILAAIIAVVAGLFLRGKLAGSMAGSSTTDEVEIVFYINDVKKETGDAAIIGETIYWQQNAMLIGTISGSESSPAEIYTEGSNGKMIFSLNEDRADLRITVRASGSMTDEGFMLNGTQFLAAGKEMILQSRSLEAESMILSITKIG